MTLFYRSYLITFGLLFAGIALVVLLLDNNGSISLHWGFAAAAVIAFIAGITLLVIGTFGRPATVDRWAETTSIHAEGTVYVALLALPVYAVLWCFSGSEGRPSPTLPITEMRNKRAKRRERRQKT